MTPPEVAEHIDLKRKIKKEQKIRMKTLEMSLKQMNSIGKMQAQSLKYLKGQGDNEDTLQAKQMEFNLKID